MVQQQEVATGNYAARGVGSGGAATYARKLLATPETDLYYRIRFKVISQAANTVNLMKFRTATDGPILSVSINNVGGLSYRNDIAGTSVNSSVIVSQRDLADPASPCADREHIQSDPGLVQRYLGECPVPNRCIRFYPGRALAVG